MPDNKVDSILLEIEATTEKADGGIDKITKALTSMKKITEGLDTEKFKQIVDVMRGFSEVGDDLKNAGSGMRGIASSIKSLSGIDTAKLKEVTAAVKDVSAALGNLGSNNRVNIRIDSEGAQRRIQPLENGQQAVASTESVATASEQAQAAMNGAASAASQLAQEENRLGSAGQSAAAGENALNESLNRTNTNLANRKIQELINQINKYKATISGMESGKVMFDTSQYSEAVNGLRQAQEQFKQFKESVTEAPKTMEDVAKAISSIGNAAQKCGLGTFSSLLNNIAAILPSIEIGGMAANAGFQSMAAGLQTVQAAIPIIGIILTILTTVINVVNQVATAVKNAVQKVVATFKELVNKIRSGIQTIINKFKELKKKVRESLGISEKQTGSFAKKLGSIVRLGTFMLLRSAFTQLFELIKTGFNNLVVYSKKAGTGFHKNVNILYNDIRQLGNSLATAFEPIINVVTPILDYLIQKLIAATNALAQFFSALTGKNFYTKAIKQNKDYADSLNSANDAANDLTTGIDELNILNEKKSGSKNDVDGSGFETEEIANKYKSLAEMIKEAWDEADFYDIGRMFGEKLKDALDNIPWDGIKTTLRKIAKSIATFLNGFLETPGLFTSIGVTIAQGINSAFEFVDSFVENFHWDSLGRAISDLIIGALDTLDWVLIRNTVKGIAQGVVEALNAALQTEDLWKKIGTAISNTVNAGILFAKTFVTELNWASLGTAIGNLLGNALAGIDYEGLGETFAGFVNGVFTAVLNFSKTFQWTELATNFANGINSALKTLDWKTIKDGFDTFCTGLGANLNTAITEIDWNLVGTTFGNSIKTIFSGIGKFLQQIDFKQIGDDLANAINKAVKTINWKEAGGTINSLVTGVCTLINELISKVDWFALMGGVTQAIAEIDWDTLLATVFRVFAAKWTFKKMFKTVSFTTIGISIVGGIKQGISSAFSGIGTWIYNHMVKPFLDAIKTKLGISDETSAKMDEIGQNTIAGFLEGITTAWLPLPLKIGKLFLDFIGWVKEKLGIHSPSTVFEEIGENTILGFINGITAKFTDCKNTILGWAANIKEWFSGTSFGAICKSTWETYGQNIIGAFKDKIGNTYTSTRDNVSAWASDIKDYFSSSGKGAINLTTFGNYADNIISGFRERIGSTYTTVRSNISAWAADVREYFAGSSHGSINATKFSTFASNIISGFKEKIATSYSECQSSITTWASKVKSWFSDTASASVFKGFAKNIIHGFRDGINSFYKDCEAAVKSWASKISDWFKEKLDINSPSKVFEQFGIYSVEGYNEGIKKEGTKTKSVMSSWADSFTDMDIKLGTRLKINDSALKDYQNNYGSDFSNEAIVQRVTKEVSTAGTIQTTLNSGGGLKTAFKEAIEELGITTVVNEISKNTKVQADKKEQTIVEIGGRTVTETVVRQRNRDGFSFQPT